jgi:hypothetical protein
MNGWLLDARELKIRDSCLGEMDVPVCVTVRRRVQSTTVLPPKSAPTSEVTTTTSLRMTAHLTYPHPFMDTRTFQRLSDGFSNGGFFR